MNYKACRTAMLAICLLALVGCSSVRPVINTSPVIAVATMSGTPQAHEVNGAFGSPLVAMVTNNGSPAGGVVVTFTAPTTGASGTFANTSNATTTATTNASGLATTAAFTANGTAGTYAVTALASGATTPASFTLTNTIGAPAAIQVTGGLTQSAPINTAFSAFVVTVVDGGGNPVSGAVVTFTASTSTPGATGTFASNNSNSEIDTTGANGVAGSSAFAVNGISGSYTLNIAVGTVSTNVTLTNSAGAPANITATGNTTETAAINAAFTPLSVLVVDGSTTPNPTNGAAVTFAVQPSSGGASGVFANGLASETLSTNAQGIASATFTANGVTGAYTVTATVAGLTPVTFNLTNQVASSTYVFYLSGQESPGSDYYALVGAVKIASGNVLSGEQDYNDAGANSRVSPEPNPDTISGGSLTVDAATGQGTLTLITSNTNLGVSGTETLGVQFVNSDHALITQFDGTATSSGSLDLQTATTLPSGGTPGYAFTLSGIDPSFSPIGFGGVFTVTPGTTTTLSGKFDTNDAGSAPVLATSLTGGLSAPDSLGRGALTGLTNPVASKSVVLNYYIVGPEVLRLIDVDTANNSGQPDSAVGSAFGQGATPPTSLGPSVFGIAGVPFGDFYAAAGMLSPTAGASFTGVADDNELSAGTQFSAVSIAGSYSLPGNDGYGSLTIATTPAPLGDINLLGLYMTDPALNLLDPNNTTSGLGGGLIADMDPVTFVAGGTGILIPQTDTTSTDFTGAYAFGAQAIAVFADEFDFVGEGSVSSLALTGTGLVSDPFSTLNAGSSPSATYSSVPFSGTATPDSNESTTGRYAMPTASTDPLNVTINGTVNAFNMVIYQASGGQLLWLDEDNANGIEFLGSLQQQGSLTGIPAAAPRKGAAKDKAKSKP